MGRAQRGMFGVLVIALGLVLLPHLNAELVVTFDPVAGETHQLERWKTPKLRRADGLPGATREFDLPSATMARRLRGQQVKAVGREHVWRGSSVVGELGLCGDEVTRAVQDGFPVDNGHAGEHDADAI